MDYQALWGDRTTVEEFAAEVSATWESEYLAQVRTDPSDLVAPDPGNGFRYPFDLAGSLGGEPCPHVPRVLGAWGYSRPGGAARDKARMAGFPRPKRGQDDRGHLIACAEGGGYDINLVPMDTALNRGWSLEGARFRAMERVAAATPGTLFFVRCVYVDDTDRPGRFEVGVLHDEKLVVELFENPVNEPVPPPMNILRSTSAALPIENDVVSRCLDISQTRDVLFKKAWQSGPGSLSRAERAAIAGVTGHVAESVVEVLLEPMGWTALWHFAGPGRHGVDLVFLAPGDVIVVVEVKGTLVKGRIPRLSRRELAQMSVGWLDKADNPGMKDIGIDSADVYGGVVIVDLPGLIWRAALTDDFASLRAITHVDQLADLTWLGPKGYDVAFLAGAKNVRRVP